MLQVVIVEDNDFQRAQIAVLAQACLHTKRTPAQFASAESFYAATLTRPPDIALLDIQLPGDNGISLAQHINTAYPACQIIYLTNFIDFAVDVYRTNHVWFVTKDRLASTLPTALEQAVAALHSHRNEVLSVPQKAGICVLQQSDIFYIERALRTTQIVAAQKTIDCNEPLDALAFRLNENLFSRCHNSYIVNLRHIAYFKRTALEISNGSTIPVSRKYYAALRDLFGQFVNENDIIQPVLG